MDSFVFLDSLFAMVEVCISLPDASPSASLQRCQVRLQPATGSGNHARECLHDPGAPGPM
jgi:hypothetical protein